MALRILFCGTPEFAVPSLRALLAAPDISIEAVITQPDRPRGRGQATTSPPVKDVGLAEGLHVFQPEKIKSESAQEFIGKIKPDAIVIIAYGQIIPAGLLEAPRLGWINVHASLLPKYRGAAPIQWAIINGETRTGVTTMRIDAGLDTGPMLEKVEVEIGTDDTAPELSRRLADVGASLIVSTLEKLERGVIVPQAQDSSRASLARPLKKGRWRDGLVGQGAANLLSDSRIGSLAWDVYDFSWAGDAILGQACFDRRARRAWIDSRESWRSSCGLRGRDLVGAFRGKA